MRDARSKKSTSLDENLSGAALKDFRSNIRRRCRRFRHFCALSSHRANSGSSANLLAVAALCSPQTPNPLGPGDEVITPAATFPTTVAPLVQNGLVPVFVDCEIGTYNADPDEVEHLPRLLEEGREAVEGSRHPYGRRSKDAARDEERLASTVTGRSLAD